ncbi:hypothetical protein ABZ038_08435, partial [Streptomyces sp. NPDC006349]
DLEPLVDAEGKPVTFGDWFTEWLDKAEHDVRLSSALERRGRAPGPVVAGSAPVEQRAALHH